MDLPSRFERAAPVGRERPERPGDEPGDEGEAALRHELERRFRTVVVELELGGRLWTLLRPESAEELISEDDFAQDERLPYWADIWPSATVLAPRVAELDGHGRRLLELGCGSGLVSSAAATAGFDVTATDYYEDALRFTRVNAHANSGRRVRTRVVDWRALPADLGTFDVVVGSDVLYERSYSGLIARVLARVLAPNGFALITDPGRMGAGAFAGECEAQGLAAERVERVAWEEGKLRQTIDVHRVVWSSRPS